MIVLQGCQVKDKVYESRRTEIYRGLRISDNQPLIFKTLKNRYPTDEELACLKNEYEILTGIDFQGTPRVFALEKYGNCPVILMEDLGGKSLAECLENKPIQLDKLLNLAVQVTDILGKIHAHGIIHKDINPTNIVWNPENQRLIIIDFGISSKLSRENLTLKTPGQLAGTLSYISPEQTGRMNRSLDYRTDFYSLGVMFYFMFTGGVPFQSSDPLELVHFHLAGTPLPPHEINDSIPPALSKIVLKLMAKTAEDRYQSTHGLKKDLEKCLNHLKSGIYEDFEIGINDISEKFQVPEKLYGREKEIANLLEVFDRTAEGQNEIIFFSGSPGIGKSVLIHEIHKPIIGKRGYFSDGKFEQFRKNIPYTAVIQAFRQLLIQILSESEEKLKIWKQKILEAVGGNGQVMIDVIGEVELIIGKQPAIQALPPVEAQNRFNLVFQNFVKVFAQKQHPLVIFLDDLQWADNASLDLIQVLAEDIDLKYSLFIGTYRDTEVDKGHPLSLMREKMEKAGSSWQDIHVGPLNQEHIGLMLADTLHCEPGKTTNLAALLHQKTGGNPFYLRELLKTLYENGFIEYKHKLSGGGAGWTWDISQIRHAGITENIVDLLVDKVNKLPSAAWEALKIACCIGEKTSLTLLASIYKKSKEETFEDLRPAIEEGVVIFIEDSLKFAHDRVVETAASLIDETERKKLHYNIGKYYVNLYQKDIPDDLIFFIANQWNQSCSLLDELQRKLLLEIDFRAGQKAKSSAAYEAAAGFFRYGSELLPGDSWDTDYKFTLSYYTEWSETEYLVQNFDKAEELSGTVLDKAVDITDKTKVYSIRIAHYSSRAELVKAMDTSNEILKQLGISLPQKGNMLLIIKEFLKLKLLLGKRKAKDLFNLPEMSDKRVINAMEIMLEYTSTAVISSPELLPILFMKMVALSLKYGNSPASSYAYVGYGAVLCSAVRDMKNGYEFGEFAVNLADSIGDKRIKSGVYLLFSSIIMHLKKNYKDMLEYLKKTHRYCIEAGNFPYLGYSYTNYVIFLFYSGEHLDSVKESWRIYSSYLERLKQFHNITVLNIWEQVIDNLSGESKSKIRFEGIFNEEAQIPRIMEQNNIQVLASFSVAKVMVTTIFDEYRQVIECAETSEKYLPSIIGTSAVNMFYYFYGLALAAHYHSVNNKKKKKYLKKLRWIQKQYKKWGDFNQSIYLHRYLLISAEIGRILDNNAKKTQQLLNRAIKLANDNGIIHEMAIACETAAKYYQSIHQEKFAALYMNEASYYYAQWGARAKVKDLEEKYPQWVIAKGKKEIPREDFVTLTRTSVTSEVFDMETIIKSSHTISSEIELDELLKKMMHIVIENAGAQKGYFLLPGSGGWFIEAEGEMGQTDVNVLQSIPVETETMESTAPGPVLPKTIVKYAERTRQTVVLDNAVNEGNFTEDEYIKNKNPKSVLCIPLINQGNLEGMLYMENNLTSGAFSEERINVLNMLSSQIAISIKNARMYRDLNELNKNLEQKVGERTRELKEKNEQILGSIRYSQKIQKTIMPMEEKIKASFTDHFIFYLPRDIVSGDFYWFAETEDSLFFAVVDCTGHGVPGALLSMMGAIFLNEIVEINKIIDPARILEELHKRVRTHLKQDESHWGTSDGMDVCICRIERKKERIYFAGAKRPLYMVKEKDGNSVFVEIRGDRKSIGGIQRENNRTYTCHEIEIKEGDMLYLTTDGFADLANPEMDKYSSRRLKAFLGMLARFPLETQKQYLLEEFETFRDSEKQRDDISIIGLRV